MTETIVEQRYCPPNIVERLKNLRLFDSLSERILMHFAEKARFSVQPKGKVLYVHGEAAEWFYVIVHGRVKLFRETLEGTEAVFGVPGSGEMFAEDSIMNDHLYTLSAECLEATQYIALPNSLLGYYIRKEPQVAINLLGTLSRHQRKQDMEIEHLHVQNASQRLGCFLLRLLHAESSTQPQEQYTLQLPYDKSLIAARLGMKPETFSRALSTLKQATGIETRGATVTITNLPKIMAYTCSHCSQNFACREEHPCGSQPYTTSSGHGLV